MNKETYLKQLSVALNGIDRDTRNEIIADYEEHFRQSMAGGMSEQQVVEQLGSVEECAQAFIEMMDEPAANNRPISQVNEPSEQDEKQSKGGITKLYVEGFYADVELVPSEDDNPVAQFSGRNPNTSIQINEVTDNVWHVGVRRVAFSTNNDLDIRLKVPSSVKEIEVRTVSGDVDITGLATTSVLADSKSGDLHVNTCTFKAGAFTTKSGDVEIQTCQIQNLKSVTASGDIELKQLMADQISAVTASGDMELDSIKAQQMNAVSASGDVEIKNSSLSRLAAKSTSGDVCLSCLSVIELEGAATSGDLSAERISGLKQASVSSVSGDVKISLDDCTGISGTMKSMSGDIRLNFGTESLHPSNGGSFFVGDGAVKLKLASSSGDITVKAR